MVTEWGMSERVGLVTYSSDNPIFLGRDMEAHNSYSEETAGIIDEEVHRIIESAHERAVKLLTENRKVLDNMARLLIERETIYTDEVDMLLEGKSLEEINDYMDKKEKSADENPFNRFMKGKDDFKPESVSADPEKAKRGDAGQPKDPGPQDENK